MAELDVGSGEGHGFKLFGTMILTEEPQPKTAEEEERSSSSSAKEVGGAPEAAVAAAETARGAAALPCPRCRSRETKFCYFNNYNVNQPRHFCRSCHRYWTAGGTLRNVPVGAGRRRNRPPARASGGAACVIEYPSPCLEAEVAAERWVLPHTGGGLPGGLR